MECDAELGTLQTCPEFADARVIPRYDENKKLLGLLGGSPPGDRQPYRQTVGGKPVYYEEPPEPRRAGREMVRRGNQYEDDPNDSEDEFISEFTNTQVRHDFIKKVYLILFMQLGFTAAVIALFVFEPTLNQFAHSYLYVSFIFLVPALILYMVLVCCASCRHSYPTNIILLSIYTVLSAVAYGMISARYTVDIVLYSFGITSAVCLVITILSMQKWCDITGWGIYLCIASVVVMLFGVAVMIVMMIQGYGQTTRILHLVYASIAALIAAMYFMFMTQLILGGKKYELSPDEYILGAIILYTEFMQLFMLIMSIFGGARS